MTASRAPPTSVTTTGRAAAMYSRITLENPSAFEASTHTSEIDKKLGHVVAVTNEIRVGSEPQLPG